VLFQDDDVSESGPDGLSLEEAEGESDSFQESDSSTNTSTLHNIRINLGPMELTAEELLACEISIKLSSNMSDACFLRHMKLLDRVLKKKRQPLPASRWKVQQKLKTYSKVRPKWAVYCPKCFSIVSETFLKPKTATCKEPTCNNYCLKGDIAKGKCMFMYLSIKDQIKGYLKSKNFRMILRKFGAMKQSHLGGALHRGLVRAGHFDLSFGIDAGQLHQHAPGKQVLPAVFFFNNIPVSWQLRYPILAALWTGSSSDQPPREVFLQRMKEELRTLGTTDPIKWTDDLGDQRRSYTFLTTVISDGPEKAELLNQVGCTGQYACPFCIVKGETLVKEKFPHVFVNNPFRRTAGEEAASGTKFPYLIHEKKFKWRKSASRMQLARTAAHKVATQDKVDFNDTMGIKGYPALRNLPRFEETDSHVSDTLHLIAHGVFKDIMKTMINGRSEDDHTFRSPGNESFETFDKMMDGMTRVSESDRNCRHLEKFGEWKAYDCMQFLLHDVALLCSNENIIKSTAVYECLVHLSNMVYLSHYGRMTPEIIKRHLSESKALSSLFIATFTHEFTTYKAHICICHGTDFLRLHGCAAFTDGFNLERFISILKKLVTTNKLHMCQICRNFILKHHSPILQNMNHFCEEAKETLNENGFFNEEFFTKFEDAIKTRHPVKTFPPQMQSLLDNFLSSQLGMDPKTTQVVRVTQMTRKSFILESEHAIHSENSRVQDSYVHLEEGIFGQITEIAYIPDSNKFLFILRKFRPMAPRLKNTALILYPINQIPYFDQRQSADFHTFLLTDNIFVQKAQISASNYFHDGRRVRIFSIQPNEWFRY
jgi:hypothetical protein